MPRTTVESELFVELFWTSLQHGPFSSLSINWLFWMKLMPWPMMPKMHWGEVLILNVKTNSLTSRIPLVVTYGGFFNFSDREVHVQRSILYNLQLFGENNACNSESLHQISIWSSESTTNSSSSGVRYWARKVSLFWLLFGVLCLVSSRVVVSVIFIHILVTIN